MVKYSSAPDWAIEGCQGELTVKSVLRPTEENFSAHTPSAYRARQDG